MGDKKGTIVQEEITPSSLASILDGSGSEKERAIIQRVRYTFTNPATQFLEAYLLARKWQTRASCIYYSFRYARTDPAALELGIKALNDRSWPVRYRACMLLAIAQDKAALSHLRNLLETTTTARTKEDALAAINAIEQENVHLFVDRDNSGKSKLKIQGITD